MKRTLPLAMAAMAFGLGTAASAQRYLSEVFSNANLTITNDVAYGTNIDFLTSNLASPNVPTEVVTLQTLVSTGQPIPAEYFDPTNSATALKVTNVRMDVYEPTQSIDPLDARPVVVYIHTGNALPPPLNGSPNGTRKDSSAVENCMRFARRGYVAVSMSYRLGWNPLAATEQERRGSLLNAIYRALHDVRQCIRNLKRDAGQGNNTYGICADRIIVVGEGTGGYIALANATLDDPAELYIEKFRPDPFNPNVSYVDSTQVGNIHGFGGNLNLYRPNGWDYESQFCVNLGGALADTSWLAPGDAPMVAFQTVFDPFAPFTEGIVIVPTTGGPVVPVQGSNLFMDLVNDYGNNEAFAFLPSGDPYTDRARALYGTTVSHGTNNVAINNAEGLFPFVRPAWPAPAMEEASPWQWWDPNSAIAQTVVSAGPPPITAHVASLASNPDMSAIKGRTYLDTIHGYLNPRIVAALDLGNPCTFVGIDEENTAVDVDVYPNPASNYVTVLSGQGLVRRYVIFDVNGRQVAASSVNTHRFIIERKALDAGTYFVTMDMENGRRITRKFLLD
ncbi:MAG: T9SS type A sorting domain-containing protein [Flavobacteriales bacterium]|nr:T9SS type A sorting domain-containing protein [Flavobacteriales bacterium]